MNTQTTNPLAPAIHYNATVFVKDAHTGKPFLAFLAEVTTDDQIIRSNGFWSATLNGTTAYDAVIRNQPFHRGNEHVIVRDDGASYKTALIHGMPTSLLTETLTQTCIHCQQRRPVAARVEHFLCDPCLTELAAFEEMCELEALQQAWDALQAVPAYVERKQTEVRYLRFNAGTLRRPTWVHIASGTPFTLKPGRFGRWSRTVCGKDYEQDDTLNVDEAEAGKFLCKQCARTRGITHQR